MRGGVLLAWMAAGAGCVEVAAEYRCASTEGCARAGERGVCELSGYCSFADSACAAAARRYASSAGRLAGQCVGQGDEQSPIARLEARAVYVGEADLRLDKQIIDTDALTLDGAGPGEGVRPHRKIGRRRGRLAGAGNRTTPVPIALGWACGAGGSFDRLRTSY